MRRADVVRWWDQLPSTPTTNARAYQLLSSVMREAVDDELIEVSPCHFKGASKPRPRHSAATVEALSADQTLAYMRAVPQRYRVALMVAAWCGLRSGEVRGLRRRDVDLRTGRLRIEQAVSRLQAQAHVQSQDGQGCGGRRCHRCRCRGSLARSRTAGRCCRRCCGRGRGEPSSEPAERAHPGRDRIGVHDHLAGVAGAPAVDGFEPFGAARRVLRRSCTGSRPPVGQGTAVGTGTWAEDAAERTLAVR